jgi:hypothetical protein
MRSGAGLLDLSVTVTDGDRLRVPVAARPKYAPKLILVLEAWTWSPFGPSLVAPGRHRLVPHLNP